MLHRLNIVVLSILGAGITVACKPASKSKIKDASAGPCSIEQKNYTEAVQKLNELGVPNPEAKSYSDDSPRLALDGSDCRAQGIFEFNRCMQAKCNRYSQANPASWWYGYTNITKCGTDAEVNEAQKAGKINDQDLACITRQNSTERACEAAKAKQPQNPDINKTPKADDTNKPQNPDPFLDQEARREALITKWKIKLAEAGAALQKCQESEAAKKQAPRDDDSEQRIPTPTPVVTKKCGNSADKYDGEGQYHSGTCERICKTGYYMGDDGRCYPTPTTACTSTEYLATDGKCYPLGKQQTGDKKSCPSGEVLTSLGTCVDDSNYSDYTGNYN